MRHRERGSVRVAIVAESFLPRINGVTNSVCRVLERLADRGCEALVIAPAPGPEEYAGHRVEVVRAVALPGYKSFPIGLATAGRIEKLLASFAPDVVHLASPVILGGAGAFAARRLEIPSVAVFQTDLAAFARRYRLWRTFGDETIWSWLRAVHTLADRTLVPSTATAAQLAARGFPRLARWGRGVDLESFNPRYRDEALRAALSPGGEVVVGYVGRLAAEKQVERLVALRGLPGVRLAIVGEGPSEGELRAALPDAAFLGFRTGEQLSRAYASLDVFVHPGADETFCQAIQEAMASGVPVVASASGGPLDLVRPGRTGFLVAPEDDARLRRAVGLLAGDALLRRQFAAAARASVLGRSWDVVVDELLEHYAQVIAHRTHAAA